LKASDEENLVKNGVEKGQRSQKGVADRTPAEVIVKKLLPAGGKEVARLDAEICLKDGPFGIWKLSGLRGWRQAMEPIS
jgi:hypothetical protein